MPSEGANTTDRNRFVSVRQRDPLTFSGGPSQDVDDWLADFDRVSVHNGWDETIKLANVVFYLAGTARTWFENHEDDFQSWDAFRSAVQGVFSVANNRKHLSSEKLATRSQREGETCTAYIEDVLWLCRRVNPDMPEAEKLSHLMKGVAEDAFQLLVVKEPGSVSEFAAACKRFEEAQWSRLGKSPIRRLPNVAGSSLPTAVDDFDLRGLIRNVLREELQVLLPQYLHRLPDAMPKEPSLKTTIREEVRAALSDLTDLVPTQSSYEPLNRWDPTTYADYKQTTPKVVASYSERAGLSQRNFAPAYGFRHEHPSPRKNQYSRSPQRPWTARKTDTWRTEDSRPICFYCCLPGHVARFCRQRIDDMSRRSGRYRQADDYNETAYQARRVASPRNSSPTRSRMPSRSPSPSRRRRRSSPYPREPLDVATHQEN